MTCHRCRRPVSEAKAVWHYHFLPDLPNPLPFHQDCYEEWFDLKEASPI